MARTNQRRQMVIEVEGARGPPARKCVLLFSAGQQRRKSKSIPPRKFA